MPPEALAGVGRVIVIRPDNIGDVILTGPLFRTVREALPDATLGLLASPGGATAAPLLPWIDEVVVTRPVWQDLGGHLPLDPAREQAFIELLADGHWDAAIIATSFRQTAWPAAYACYLAGIPIRVGFARDFGGSVLSHPLPPPADDLHQGLRNLRLAEGLGLDVADDEPEIAIPADAAAEIATRLAKLGIERGDAILVVPGASAAARRMEPERYGRAAAVLAAATGRPILVTGTTRERGLLAAVRESAPMAIELSDLSVPAFAALIDAAAVVLCGNSAALHLADALRRPVVVAYSGTDLVSQWEPRATRAALLSVPVECSPCYRIDCPIGVACLRLDPDDLAHRALAFLDDVAAPRPRPVTGDGESGSHRRRRARPAEEVRCVA
jgi:ADP-heptose:LPS heptosyltransferase